MALGAARTAVVMLVLKDSFWMLFGGTAVGLSLALLATPPLSSFLILDVNLRRGGVHSHGFVLGAVALTASAAPVLRHAGRPGGYSSLQ